MLDPEPALFTTKQLPGSSPKYEPAFVCKLITASLVDEITFIGLSITSEFCLSMVPWISSVAPGDTRLVNPFLVMYWSTFELVITITLSVVLPVFVSLMVSCEFASVDFEYYFSCIHVFVIVFYCCC